VPYKLHFVAVVLASLVLPVFAVVRPNLSLAVSFEAAVVSAVLAESALVQPLVPSQPHVVCPYVLLPASLAYLLQLLVLCLSLLATATHTALAFAV